MPPEIHLADDLANVAAVRGEPFLDREASAGSGS